jgi:hypothetical protein
MPRVSNHEGTVRAKAFYGGRSRAAIQASAR